MECRMEMEARSCKLNQIHRGEAFYFEGGHYLRADIPARINDFNDEVVSVVNLCGAKIKEAFGDIIVTPIELVAPVIFRAKGSANA